MKAFSIVGICWAVLCAILVVTWSEPYDYEAGLGWGLFAAMYLLAMSIVVLVRTNKK